MIALSDCSFVLTEMGGEFGTDFSKELGSAKLAREHVARRQPPPEDRTVRRR